MKYLVPPIFHPRTIGNCRCGIWNAETANYCRLFPGPRGGLASSLAGRANMSEHKYQVGQAVEFFPQRSVQHTAKGHFKIVRLLLGERNAPHYRIRHQVDGHERMVDEPYCLTGECSRDVKRCLTKHAPVASLG